MKLEVRLFAYLRDGRGKKVFLDISDSTSVQDVLDTLGITHEEASILLVKGMDTKYDYILKEGDYLSIFPPVGGG